MQKMLFKTNWTDLTMNKVISTDKAPKAIGPYSQAILSGNTLYCSGQIAINPATNTFIEGLLASIGFSYSDVVKTTCFLADMNDFTTFNNLYEKAFISKPARSCVAVKTLPKNALVEIEVIAVKN